VNYENNNFYGKLLPGITTPHSMIVFDENFEFDVK
jgi:hypothetical protein